MGACGVSESLGSTRVGRAPPGISGWCAKLCGPRAGAGAGVKVGGRANAGGAVGLEPRIAVYWPESYPFFLHDQMGLARLAAKVPPGYKVRRGQGWPTSDRGTGNYVLGDQTLGRMEADRPSSSVFRSPCRRPMR